MQSPEEQAEALLKQLQEQPTGIKAWSFGKKIAALFVGLVVAFALLASCVKLIELSFPNATEQASLLKIKSDNLAKELFESGDNISHGIQIKAVALSQEISLKHKLYSASGMLLQHLLVFILVSILFRLVFIPKRRSYYLLKEGSLRLYLLIPFLFFTIVPILQGLKGVSETLGLEDLAKADQSGVANTILNYAIFTPNSKLEFFIFLFVVAIIPAISEELLFRGTIQTSIIDRFGNKDNAIFITAFIFAAIHMQWSMFLYLFTMGVILGYIYYWGRSILLPMLFHFINNALSLLYLYDLKNIELEETAASNQVLSPTTILVASLFAAIGLWIFYRDYRTWLSSKFLIKK